jgi:hypothetical protein
MFVRFRKVANGGFRPRAAANGVAKIICRGRCFTSCRMHPRCRWAIDKDRRMEPYRVKVMLVANTRVNGKVKQELVASLGSIDATWLDSFWATVGEDELTGLRVPDWRLQSLKRVKLSGAACSNVWARSATTG